MTAHENETATPSGVDTVLKLLLTKNFCNYSGMLIGLLIAILYFLERNLTTEYTESTETTTER